MFTDQPITHTVQLAKPFICLKFKFKTIVWSGILTLHNYGDKAFCPPDIAVPDEHACDKMHIYCSTCPSDWVSPPEHPKKKKKRKKVAESDRGSVQGSRGEGTTLVVRSVFVVHFSERVAIDSLS